MTQIADERAVREAYDLNRTLYESQLAGVVSVYRSPRSYGGGRGGLVIEGADEGEFLSRPSANLWEKLAVELRAMRADPWDYMWLQFTALPGIESGRNRPPEPAALLTAERRARWSIGHGKPAKFVAESLERQLRYFKDETEYRQALFDYTVTAAYKVVLADRDAPMTPLFRYATSLHLRLEGMHHVTASLAWSAAAEYRQLRRHYDALWAIVPGKFKATADAVYGKGIEPCSGTRTSSNASKRTAR